MSRCVRRCFAAGAVLLLVGSLLVSGCAVGNAVRTEHSPPGLRRAAPQQPHEKPIPEAYAHFTTGNIYAAAGDDSAAIVQYRRALTFDPSSRAIRFALAQSYARTGRWDEAAITAEGIRPRDPELLGFLADIYMRMHNAPRRVAIFEEWSRVDPSDERIWQFLANAYRATQDTTKLEQTLVTLANLRPDPVVFEQLGLLQLQRGEESAAEASFHRAVAIDSTQKATRVLLGLAQIWMDRHEPDSAYVYYRRAVDLNYYNTELRKRFIDFLLQADRREESLEQARIVLTLSPGEPDVLYKLALLEYDAEELDSAQVHFTELVTDFGDDAMARYFLGRIALAQGDSTTAEAQYRQSLELADTLVDPYLSLGFLYSQQKQYGAAVRLYRQGLDVLPEQPNLLFGLGAALERAGQFDESVAVFERLLKASPDHAPALNYLGYMLADRGIRLREALKLIEHAVELEPENGAFLDSYAWVLFKLGRTRDAAEKLRKALAYVQTDAVVFEHYGDILADLGKEREAEENWRKALELDPENAALREKLKR